MDRTDYITEGEILTLIGKHLQSRGLTEAVEALEKYIGDLRSTKLDARAITLDSIIWEVTTRRLSMTEIAESKTVSYGSMWPC